jgi:hypothetical protein
MVSTIVFRLQQFLCLFYLSVCLSLSLSLSAPPPPSPGVVCAKGWAKEQRAIHFVCFPNESHQAVLLENAFCKVEQKLEQVLLKYLIVSICGSYSTWRRLCSATVLQPRMWWYCNYNTSYPFTGGEDQWRRNKGNVTHKPCLSNAKAANQNRYEMKWEYGWRGLSADCGGFCWVTEVMLLLQTFLGRKSGLS